MIDITETLLTYPRDPANRWPLCVFAFDDFHTLLAVAPALASGR